MATLIPPFCAFFLLLLPAVSSSAPPNCPPAQKYGSGPPPQCQTPSDPNNRMPSPIEQWFTREMFNDLFPYANLGWGPHECAPYSYENFVLAARYFPRFGAESPPATRSSYKENTRRDVAAFLAHAVQETGMNDLSVYQSGLSQTQADGCFYRGGLFNWFEGGPVSAFLDPASPGYSPADGHKCAKNGRYCSPSTFYPCGNGTEGEWATSCYFGRGAIQISYNYNYGQFGEWLHSQNITVDLLSSPNLILTKTDPPLALLASLWFYMTPQPPKPAMHDIVLVSGQWYAGKANEASGYSGPIFGPTSLVINNECTGKDPSPPGDGGENRRIRAYIWFCDYFGVSAGNETLLSCKNMPQKFDQIAQNLSWQPDWSSTWRQMPCKCAPAGYGGIVPYFQPDFYPAHFVHQNEANRLRCEQLLYQMPDAFGMDAKTSVCLNQTRQGDVKRGSVEEGKNNASDNNDLAPVERAGEKRNNGSEGVPTTTSATATMRTASFAGFSNYLRPELAAIG